MDRKSSMQKEFFASANTYFGFKSYFGEIFNSAEYDRIFVLKGGPGTGKSTLLKKICNDFALGDLTIERFRCSSDEESLDGLIIENDGKRVAVIDGTAPHERDAVIPGAVDTLVNLGEAINNDAISKYKSTVLELNEKKKSSYRKAYNNLYKSSIFYTNIKAEIVSRMNNDKVKREIETLISLLDPSKNNATGIRLLGAFSKRGKTFLDTLLHSVSRRFYVSGAYGCDTVFLTSLADFLVKIGVPFIKIVSALDPESTEGIYFTHDDALIVRASDELASLDTRMLFGINEKNAISDELKALDFGMKSFEEMAKNALAEASKYHFELEDVYKSSVDFKIIDTKYEYIKEGISKIFL